MNGNPLYHWMGLAVATMGIAPLSVAMLAGWAPPGMRKRRAGLWLRACGFLCFYALTLLSAVPRIADASSATVIDCMRAGWVVIALAAVLFLLAERKDAHARAAGPEGPVPSPGDHG
ncbi:hypothetical protein [Streptomyces sp. NPDC057616]|uniref:hypothetical protein n=1 Tax=Streptomyces sp. NPDC057616 TaxID=3346183 RepID=UPI0036AEA017